MLPMQSIRREEPSAEGAVQADLFIAVAQEDFAIEDEVEVSVAGCLHIAVLTFGTAFGCCAPALAVDHIQPSIGSICRKFAFSRLVFLVFIGHYDTASFATATASVHRDLAIASSGASAMTRMIGSVLLART